MSNAWCLVDSAIMLNQRKRMQLVVDAYWSRFRVNWGAGEVLANLLYMRGESFDAACFTRSG
jgi:hypothetical protein